MSEESSFEETINWAKNIQDNPPSESSKSMLFILCIGAFFLMLLILVLWIIFTEKFNKDKKLGYDEEDESDSEYETDTDDEEE